MINHNKDKNFEKGSGLYRVQDTDGDDHYDKITLLKALDGKVSMPAQYSPFSRQTISVCYRG